VKVLQVIPSMARSYGGPSVALAQTQEIFQDLGIESVVVTTRDTREGALTWESSERLRLFERQWPFFYFFSRPLDIWLNENIRNFDIVHIHSLFSFPALVAGRYARKYQIPYLIEPFGTMDEFCMKRHWIRKKFYFEMLERKSLNGAKYVRAVSLSEKEELSRFKLRSKCVVIPLGVRIIPDQRVLKSGVGSSEKSNVKKILYLSRIDPKKGLKLLLGAINLLAKKRQDFKLVIAGGGRASYVERIKKEAMSLGISNQIAFVGEVGGDYKKKLLEDADIFVLPSYRENFGIAVAEALEAGCSVIVSREVAIAREIKEASAGLVISLEVRSIYEALDELLNNDQLRIQMAIRAKKMVGEKFDLDKNTRELAGIYETMRK